ncbi:DUF6286 domain-containing protein [Actinomadura opuntiae]|uniref:DUF6286 domain-containing protein n=1 Tax=Actinomadura sp. OS1-43 TaxID=604315 RepID=UPI00255AD9A7|nr:DUF6286 domain-containing protein [Actinomadura sp. OS1-43]MDL4818547.1 DUF6286 domain-containing protein [Actinomadura sp. OS1-43]
MRILEIGDTDPSSGDTAPGTGVGTGVGGAALSKGGLGPDTGGAVPRATGPGATGILADRPTRRRAARAFRTGRRLPAVLTAAALAAAALLTATEVIGALAGHPPHLLPVSDLARLGRDTRWDDSLAVTAAGAAVAVGGLLILLGAVPGRSRTIPLATGDPRVVLGITRRGMRRCIAHAAASVDGVATTKIKIRRRRIRVRATSPLRDAGGLGGQVREAVGQCVGELAPLRPPRVRVTIRHREN